MAGSRSGLPIPARGRNQKPADHSHRPLFLTPAALTAARAARTARTGRAQLDFAEDLLRLPQIADAAVVPVPDPVGMWAPKAYLVPAPGWAPDQGTADLVGGAVLSGLSPEKRVRFLEFVPALSRTASGKVRRSALKGLPPGREFAVRPAG